MFAIGERTAATFAAIGVAANYKNPTVREGQKISVTKVSTRRG